MKKIKLNKKNGGVFSTKELNELTLDNISDSLVNIENMLSELIDILLKKEKQETKDDNQWYDWGRKFTC